MSDQKVVARRLVEEVWNQGKLTVIDELVAHNADFHDPNVPGGKFTGPEGFKQFVSIYRAAFSDLHITINEQLADGDKVVTRWTSTGTNNGALMSISPTHKHATVQGVNIDRYENGKIVEGWVSYDMLGMLQQLGMEPMAVAAIPA